MLFSYIIGSLYFLGIRFSRLLRMKFNYFNQFITLLFQRIHVLQSQHQNMERWYAMAGEKILLVFVSSLALLVTPIPLAIPQITGTRVVPLGTGFRLPCSANVYLMVSIVRYSFLIVCQFLKFKGLKSSGYGFVTLLAVVLLF